MQAAAEENAQPLTDEQKMEQVRGYFESEYQEEDYFRTDRLLMTATRHLLEAKDAPAIASVITAEEIRDAGAMNLLDVLQRLPGIGITRNFYSVYEIEIRGLKSTRNNRVQLMVDGHKMEYPTTGGASWAWDTVSLEQVKRVEVIRGPGSALYGANALSGVVNVVSKKGGDIDGTFNWELFPEGFITLPPGIVPPPPLTIENFTFPDGVLGTPHWKDKTYGVEFGTDYKIADNNKLTLGLVYEKLDHGDVTHHANFDPNTGINLGSFQDITSWANWSQELTRELKAAFIQDEWRPTENVGVTAGIRYDDYSDVGDSTNPRLGVVWNLHQKADIKLLYGTAFRVPTLDELYSINNPAAVGNPDLTPEEMETFEAGLVYRPLGGVEINASTFYNQISDIIRLVPTGFPGGFQFENTGDATIYGVEVDLRYYWQRENEAYFNYTWQHPEDDETGEEIPDVPSNRWNIGLTMRFFDHLKGNVNVLYVGERPRVVNDPRPDLDSYTKVDMTAIADNLFKTLEIRGSIYNLLDEDYSYPATPGTLLDDYPAPGRTFFVEARFSF